MRNIVLGTIWAAALLALAAGVLSWLRQPTTIGCAVCQRPIHANTHAVALVEGRQVDACCPRCVLTLRQQLHQDAHLLQVSDYLTAQALSPETAYYVEGSAVETCSTPRLRSNEGHTVYERHFDRCAPSLLAFAREDQARAFVSQNGGSLKRLEDLLREVSPASEAEERRNAP